MYKFLKNLSCLLCLILVFGGCRKKAFDDFYNPPANAQPPIYQVLKARGNFKTLLSVIDKSGYTPTLSAAGYWTFFAPNDAAFQKYFTANNTSLDKITAAQARQMVTYWLVYNAFKTDHIADYQSTLAKGWVTAGAFKRRTANYTSFYKIATPTGIATTDSIVVQANNRNGSFVFGDNNNKYIPYFYSSYMTARGLSASDYNFFYPSTTYTGFNVVNSSVVTADILAANGVIHEIDNVFTPLKSLEEQLASNPDYSLFKSLYDQYISYVANTDATRQYATQHGSTVGPTVYIKQYATTLAFAPNNENFMKVEDNDGQSDGYTLFAPTNAALTNYLNTVILEFYHTLSALPSNIILDLLNAHMWQSTVWPSKFNSTINFVGEPARFTASDIVDKQFCSNGVFYGASKPQAANVFSTVYARAYLDPAYTMMTRLFDVNLKQQITNPSAKYVVFMLPDAVLNSLGYTYNATTQVFTYTVNGSSTTANVQNNLIRILNLNVVPVSGNELSDLSGDGIAESNAGEYIRWHNNTVSSGGTVEKNIILSVTGSRTYSNGKIYYLSTNGMLDYPVKTLAADIAANADVTNAANNYYDFNQYLINSSVYDATGNEIVGLQLGANYTVFIPTQAALKQAVIDGVLPGSAPGGVFASFNYKPTASADIDKVARFIYYHILGNITIAPDGKKGGALGTNFPTLLKDANGNALNLTILNNNPGTLSIRDNYARTATIIPPNNASYFPATSNYLGTRTLFHQINNYLKFNYFNN